MPVVAYHELQTDKYTVAGFCEESCMHAGYCINQRNLHSVYTLKARYGIMPMVL